MPLPRRPLAIVLTVVAVVAACGGDSGTAPQPVTTIVAVSGSGQTGTVGAELPEPLVIRVTTDGAPAVGTPVGWSTTLGGGSLGPSTGTTGSDGTASVTWTLGPDEGSNLAEASVAGATGSPVVFSATGASAAAPMAAAVSVGDNFFDPTSARVAVGGTVTWTWAGSGAVSHNVTFPGGGPSSANQTSGMFASTFDTAGSFAYSCTIHGAAMSGTVVVVAP